MKKSETSSVSGPFKNLMFLLMFHKTFGLIACRLVNGRLRPSNLWSNCYCASWILLHIACSSVYYYSCFTASSETKSKTYFSLSVTRYTIFFVSMLPYHFVAIVKNQDFVKFSDKLEEYDEKTMMLKASRKNDSHRLTWLYFVCTFIMLFLKGYHCIVPIFEKGTAKILLEFFEVVLPAVVGTYCVFITVIYLDAIRQRFRHLNERIIPHVSRLSVTESQGKITMYDVRYLYNVLLDSVKLLENVYGFGSLITFTSILLEFVAVIYLFLKNTQQDNTWYTIVDLTFQAIFLFATYHFTASEGNRVSERVEKYGLSYQNTKCRMDNIEMMLYFYHTKIAFTAAQFFILDLTIFLPISSTVLTFITLVI